MHRYIAPSGALSSSNPYTRALRVFFGVLVTLIDKPKDAASTMGDDGEKAGRVTLAKAKKRTGEDLKSDGKMGRLALRNEG